MKSLFAKSERCLAVLIVTVFALATGAQCQTPPQFNLQLSNGFAHLSITGEIGSGCTIQSVADLSQNWQFVTNFTIQSNPFLLVDGTGAGAGQRFYRAFSQQEPTNVVMSNLVWISPGRFTMGSPDTEAERLSREGPRTQVTISHGFWMGKYQVTQSEYASLIGSNPSQFTGNLSRPVEYVSWNDAVAYCDALTTRERNAGQLPNGYAYRLPTEAEWEYACRAGTTTAFHYGSSLRSGMANFNGHAEYDASIGTISNDSGIFLFQTTAVGSYAPNGWGLYDMHGNVWEWCQDWYSDSLPGGGVTDPQGPASGLYRLARGGGWVHDARFCRSAYRDFILPGRLRYDLGFRVVLAVVPPTNMVWISPGTFTMGSPETEALRYSWEGPQTMVTISRGFWMGKYEVTQREYSSLMGNNPSYFTATNGYGTDLNRPVEDVTWNDAVSYCVALTTQERDAGWLPGGYAYRLPTQAEWEYACRAGTTTAFAYGPSLRSGMANFPGQSEYDASIGTIYNPNGIWLNRTTSVGSYAPNAWGLYDMHGNVWEWCQDWWSDSLPGGSITDPQGPSSGTDRAFRGGGWNSLGYRCRSAASNHYPPDSANHLMGFRVVLAPGQP